MTSPAIEQDTIVEFQAGVTSKFADLASVAEASSIIAGVVIARPTDAPNPIQSVVAQRMVSGVPTGSPYTMSPDDLIDAEFEQRKAVGMYRVAGVVAGDYRITATAAEAGSSIALLAAEMSVEGVLQGVETAPASTVNDVTSITLGPAPEAGDLAADDALAVVMVTASDGMANIAWNTPSGWTLVDKQDIGTDGKQTFFMAQKTLSAADAVSVTVTTGASALYGLEGVLVVYVPTTGPTLTKKIKIVNKDDTPDGLDGINVDVHANPVTGEKGSRIFTATDQTWDTIEGGKSVMKITVPASGSWEVTGLTLSVDDTVVVTGGADDSSHGFVRRAIGIVIEE